jgi:ELWxxDGT repeat protein
MSSSEIDGRPQIVFSASDTGHGRELWVTDGTAAGTRLLADVTPGPEGSNARPEFARDGKVYFWARDSEGTQWLWSSDGTPEGTGRFGSIRRGRHDPIESTSARAGQWTVFHAGGGPDDHAVWVTDGTEGNTRPLIEAMGDLFSPAPMASVGGAVLVSINASIHGRELWITDGTPDGSRLLKDINRYDESWQPTVPVQLGDRLVFAAEAPGLGREMFVSDGTLAGTSLLVDAHPGLLGARPTDLVVAGDVAYFLAKRGSPNQRSSLYLTDGTPAGTRVVIDSRIDGGWLFSRQSLAAAGPRLLFSAMGVGSNAWILDSPSASPRQLTGLDNSWPGKTAPHTEYLAVQDGFFFTARATFGDDELWRSDGTVAGTRPAVDIWPGSIGSRPRNLRTDGALVYFFAHSPAGSGLFCSDGTAAGTRYLARMSALDAPEPVKTSAGNRTFFIGIDESHGSELWVTDGSPEGTRRLRDLTPGPASTQFGALKAAGPLLYFACTTPGFGTELWRSNGTEAGTFLLRDIAPGETSSRPANIHFHLGHCFFSAWDPEHGRELWSTDGTPAGTALVEDVQPGESWSQPIGLATMGDRLVYFESADTLAQSRLRLLPSAAVVAVVSNAQQGRVTGAGRFGLGVRVPLTALPEPGFMFSHWQGGGVVDPQSEATHLRLIGDTQVTAVFRPVPSLVEWLRSFGLDGAAALDPMAELAGDGLSSFIKYAFGLDPTVPHGTGGTGENESPLPTLVHDESGQLRLSHLRRRNAPLRYEAQVSSTLRPWEPLTAAVQSVKVLSSQWERVTYVIEQPSTPAATTLLRVKVEATGP